MLTMASPTNSFDFDIYPPSYGEEGYPFSEADEPEPYKLKCKCGGEEFVVYFPAPFVTCASCTSCHKSGVIHEG